MDIFQNIYFIGFLIEAIILGLFFVISYVLKRRTIIDAGFGLSIALASFIGFLFTNSKPIHLVVTLFAVAWGFSMMQFVSYKALKFAKENAGATKSADTVFSQILVVFVPRVIVAFVMSLPIFAILSQPLNIFKLVSALGVTLIICGLIFEWTANLQLISMWTKTSKTTAKGLWKYSQHPNYFGDICFWLGMFCIAIPVGELWTIIGPITVILVLAFTKNHYYESFAQENNQLEAKKGNFMIPWFAKE